MKASVSAEVLQICIIHREMTDKVMDKILGRLCSEMVAVLTTLGD